jgi:hypothetical protein
VPRAGRCPNCGEPVSAFAAGCAICGADLEAARRKQERNPVLRVQRGAGALRPAPGVWTNVLLVAVLVLFALFFSLLGLLLSALIAYDRNRNGQLAMRNVAIGCGALALAVLLAPLPVKIQIYQLLA